MCYDVLFKCVSNYPVFQQKKGRVEEVERERQGDSRWKSSVQGILVCVLLNSKMKRKHKLNGKFYEFVLTCFCGHMSRSCLCRVKDCIRVADMVYIFVKKKTITFNKNKFKKFKKIFPQICKWNYKYCVLLNFRPLHFPENSLSCHSIPSPPHDFCLDKIPRKTKAKKCCFPAKII